MLDWDDGDRFSFDDSDRFEDSLCSWSSEPESLCNNWRGWKKPTIVVNNVYGLPAKKSSENGGAVGSLCELAARTVAAHIPFELVEHVYPPVPEQLQLRIAFWSFPDNEEDIRLYSCLANGSSEEFGRGDTLFKNRNVKDPLQIGFHLSASVTVPHGPINSFDRYNVAVTFDRRRITSCNCTCSSTAYWCSHVVAVCLHRIHLPNEVCLRAPVSESLSRLHREQLQKFAQYLISELPQQILPTAQRLLDELLSLQPSAINSVCGAPDPTAGASVNDQTSWYLDEKTLHNNIRKIVIKFCVPAPIVFSDVNYLSTTAPPAAAEWSSLLRPLRGREPEGMWNLLSIVREMFKRNDRNAIPLLEIITKECMACDQILVWWFNTKVALHIGSAGHGGGKHSNINSNSHTSQHACASLCDEIVVLWRLAALNPGLSPEERVVLRDQFKDWHRNVVLKVTKSRGVPSTMSPFGGSVGGAHNKAKDGAGFRSDLEVFPGFRPALEASHLDWNDYQIPGITYQGGVSRLYHCPFTCFRHGGEANCTDGTSPQVSSSQAVLNCEPVSAYHSSHNQLYYFHHHNPHLHHNGGCVGQKQRAGRVSGFTEFSYNNKRRGDLLNFNMCQKNYTHGEQTSRKRNNDGNRSSVSSEGFCENETDADILTEGDVVAMVAGRSAQVETDSQEGGGSDSSTSSSNSHGAYNSASNSNAASSSSSGSRPHPKRRTDAKDSKAAPRKDAPRKDAPRKDAPRKDAPRKDAPRKDTPRKDTPRKECSAEGEAAKTAFQEHAQAPDGSDSTAYSFDEDLGDDDTAKSSEKAAAEEKAAEAPEPMPSTSGMSNPSPSLDAAVPSTSAAADVSAVESRRPSKDDSVSSTSGSAHNSGDEYMMYFYKSPVPMVNVEKNSANNEKKDEKANVMTTLSCIFESVKKSSDPWDILFARAEGLHAHGHGREACILGVQLAEELLAHPPELMIELPPLIAKGKRRKHVNPASHQISCLATATLAKCAFLCTVLAENREHFHLAFRVGMFGLEMARPPASTKPLEVKLANQESELIALLKRIPLGHRELAMIRERAQQLRDGALKSRGEALLPIMLASFIFDALVNPATNRPSERCQFFSPAVRCPGDEQLGFEAAVAAMGLKANVSEADHPLLCEGTRRQRGELAVSLLVHYRDDPEKIARIMHKLLDREVHQLIKTPLHADYYTSNPPIKSQRRREEARNRELGVFAPPSACDQPSVEGAPLSGGTNSRPNSSTSAELDQGLIAMSLNSSVKTLGALLTNPVLTNTTPRSKDSRYKGKRAYPSIPNQPSDSGAHFMCELAKTVLMKAGGNSSTSLFTQAPPANSQMGPHRALHMCAFQIGLYALGLHNCVSPNWLSRTYSSHVSWITGQAMEIGAAAISFLIDTWEGHLTPPEAVSIADRASRGCDPNMVNAAAELALSCLPHSHALNPNEIQQAILQCKDQGDHMLEQSCLTIENAAKGGGVYPEVLFQVAKYWYELYAKHSPGGEQPVEVEPMPESIFTLDGNAPMVALVDSPNGAALPNAGCAQSVVVKAAPQPALASLIPVMPAPYSVAPFSYALPNLHHPAHPFTASINMNQRQVQMFITPQAFPAAQMPPYSAIPAQRNMQFFSAVSLAPNGQQSMNKNMHQGGAPGQQQMHHHLPQMYPMQQIRPQLGPQMGPQPQPPMQSAQQQGPPMQQMPQQMPQQLAHQRPQLPVVKQVQQMPVQQVPVQQMAVQQVPVQTNQVIGGMPVPPMIPNAPPPVQQRPQQVHRQQGYTQIQLRYLLAAYRVGMLALETLARRVHDDRPQAKYTRNPPYGEDVKWLLRISKKLGAQYLHQFCVCAVSSIVSPFVLHDVAVETGQYLSRHNPSIQSQHLRSALNPLVQKCQQMYIQCLHQKLYHLISGDYEEFVNIVCSARAAFQLTPEGNQQFKEWLQSIRRSKSCKKDLWTEINAALQSNSK